MPPDKFEVVVVDNGSNPPIVLPELYKLTIDLQNCETVGSFAARNHGIIHSEGACLAFLDADCIPDKEWLRVACEFMKNCPQIDAAAGAIEMTFSKKMTAAECYEAVFSLRQEKSVSEYGFGFTANLFVRRSAFNKFGLFDPALKSGGDREWGQRLHLAGGKMAYVPGAIVQHAARSTLGQLIKKRRRLEGGRMVVPKINDLDSHWEPKIDSTRPRGFAMAVRLIANPSSLGVKRGGGIKALIVAVGLVVVGWMERIRLGAGREARRE